MHTAFAELGNCFEDGERTGAAGISRGKGSPIAELRDEFVVNAATQAFHVHGMNEELSAMLAEGLERFTIHFEFGEFLPAVGDDKIFSSALAATEVEHEAFA